MSLKQKKSYKLVFETARQKAEKTALSRGFYWVELISSTMSPTLEVDIS